MNFSQRIGKTNFENTLQVESLNYKTRMKLWNYHYSLLFITFKNLRAKKLTMDDFLNNDDSYIKFWICIWEDYFDYPLDEFNLNSYLMNIDKFKKLIKDHFLDAEWNKVLDIIEFLYIPIKKFEYSMNAKYNYEDQINLIFDNNNVGYRFLNKIITPIFNQNELESIEQVINNEKYKSINKHMTNALNYLSDRKRPDYKNSIKESISAVESISKIIMNNENVSLSKVIEKLGSKIYLNNNFKKGIKYLYDYTSDEDGIRHGAFNTSDNVTKSDAKFMLVICSAFVNYLIEKWDLIKENNHK